MLPILLASKVKDPFSENRNEILQVSLEILYSVFCFGLYQRLEIPSGLNRITRLFGDNYLTSVYGYIYLFMDIDSRSYPYPKVAGIASPSYTLTKYSPNLLRYKDSGIF
jgi:hypothetical protein